MILLLYFGHPVLQCQSQYRSLGFSFAYVILSFWETLPLFRRCIFSQFSSALLILPCDFCVLWRRTVFPITVCAALLFWIEKTYVHHCVKPNLIIWLGRKELFIYDLFYYTVCRPFSINPVLSDYRWPSNPIFWHVQHVFVCNVCGYRLSSI